MSKVFRPCPLCGGKAVLRVTGWTDATGEVQRAASARCTKCGLSFHAGRTGFKDARELARAWEDLASLAVPPKNVGVFHVFRTKKVGDDGE